MTKTIMDQALLRPKRVLLTCLVMRLNFPRWCPCCCCHFHWQDDHKQQSQV